MHDTIQPLPEKLRNFCPQKWRVCKKKKKQKKNWALHFFSGGLLLLQTLSSRGEQLKKKMLVLRKKCQVCTHLKKYNNPRRKEQNTANKTFYILDIISYPFFLHESPLKNIKNAFKCVLKKNLCR